tara:strand:+ start:207 stop:365 length:159 start_codon:yes stop_codon:yes gene_type:complete
MTKLEELKATRKAAAARKAAAYGAYATADADYDDADAAWIAELIKTQDNSND